MSLSSSFLWRFLDDVWDLLPTEDRNLFEAYWRGFVRIGGNLQQKTLELAAGISVHDVPVHLTERWNRFVMNEDSCDLFQKTDQLVLNGTVATALSQKAVMFHTLVVSNATGQVFHTEQIRFFDSSVRQLARKGVVLGTLSVKGAGDFEYTENRDYVVNREEGTIQALEDGRIPTTEYVTIYYRFAAYELGVDYTVDELNATVARTADSLIPNAGTVSVTYTYNATPTVSLQGTDAQITFTSLIDTSANFSGVPVGSQLTIANGPNAGTYTISSVLSVSEVQISGLFPATQASGATYSIAAFRYGLRVNKSIVSIPLLQERIEDPTRILVENVDFVVRDGILATNVQFPMETLGPEEDLEPTMWAEVTKINDETPYRNYGVLIDFYRSNSEAYRLALQGLWYTFWTGSSIGNLRTGLQILLGLPFAQKAGTVTSLSATEIQITDDRGQIITYTIPSGLVAEVALGDAVTRFQALTNGVKVIDQETEPGFVEARLGRAGINRFLTDNATVGPGNSDETKALKLLEAHLFIPQVLTEAIFQKINVDELYTFLDNMKPQWTEYVFAFNNEDEESLTLTDEDGDEDWAIDLTATPNSNQFNEATGNSNFFIASATGETIGGGSQATGNFRDVTQNFTTSDVGAGDVVRIASGTFKGYWLVLKRIDNVTISIDIPDAALSGLVNIDYVVLPNELGMGYDALQFKREHLIMNGTEFLAPAVLNTKTNIDLASMTNAQLQAMLLIDESNAGNEVQSITAARQDLDEITVATPPAVAVQDHQIASCALHNYDTGGAVFVEAFAI